MSLQKMTKEAFGAGQSTFYVDCAGEEIKQCVTWEICS
jgi:hypothetical protein